MTKVVFETATIAEAIKKADRVAPSKGEAFDKAAGILMEIGTDTTVTIRATNLEVFQMEWVEALDIEGESATWRIPSTLLAQVVSKLPIGSGRTVTFEEKESGSRSHLLVSSGRMKAKYNLMDTTDYPRWDVFDPDDLDPINDLGGRIAQVEWAAAKGGIPPLNGVFINGERVICTDRYKLVCSRLKIGSLANSVLVPAGILGTILKQTGEVKFGVTENQVLLMPNEYTQIRAVLYDAQYPKVDRLMNRDYPQCIKLKRGPLIEMIDRAMAFAGNDRFPLLRVFLGKQEIAVMVSNADRGNLGDILDVPGQADHPRIEMKFTPKFLTDSISNGPNDEIELYYNNANPTKPIYIDGGSGYEAWVMPRKAGEVQE